MRLMVVWAVLLVAAGGVAVMLFFREPNSGERACAERCAAGNFANHQFISPSDAKPKDAKDAKDGDKDTKDPAATTCRCW